MKAIIWAAVSSKSQMRGNKDSLEDQVKQAVAVCDEFGWTIIDTLEVPGFSRKYYELSTLADIAAQQTPPILAPAKLKQHIEAMDFDVLVTRGDSRLGRTQTLLTSIIEQITDGGGQVYTYGNKRFLNSRGDTALSGFKVASELDDFRKRQKMGYKFRFQHGLPKNGSIIGSHKAVRDPQSGKMIDIVINEARRQEFLDLAELILEGVAWSKIEREMYKRFGHARPDGKPYTPATYYRMIYTPGFWGHHASGSRDKGLGKWLRLEGYPVPDGVEIEYNVFEPVYTGELATRIHAELDRRMTVRGRHNPHNSYKFSRLIICGECGYTMSHIRGSNPSYISLRCQSKYAHHANRPNCSNSTYINETVVIEQIKPVIDAIISTQRLDMIYKPGGTIANTRATLEQIDSDIQRLEQKIRGAIQKQLDAPAGVLDMYADVIRADSDRLEILKARRDNITEEIKNAQDTTDSQQQAIADITAVQDGFWELPDNRINQLLKRILGDYKIVVLGHEVKGFALYNR